MSALLPLWSRDIPTRVIQHAHIPVTEEAGTETITSVFAFDPADPYAITARFTVDELAVEWVFARDLLADGIHRASGDGDVHVSPHGACVRLRLNSPNGTINLECARTPLAWFLKAVFTLVPRGDESEYVHVDHWLGSLLNPQ